MGKYACSGGGSIRHGPSLAQLAPCVGQLGLGDLVLHPVSLDAGVPQSMYGVGNRIG